MSLIGGQIDTRLQLARSQPAMLLRATHIYQHTGRGPPPRGLVVGTPTDANTAWDETPTMRVSRNSARSDTVAHSEEIE
jgi:hypothetical protein